MHQLLEQCNKTKSCQSTAIKRVRALKQAKPAVGALQQAKPAVTAMQQTKRSVFNSKFFLDSTQE